MAHRPQFISRIPLLRNCSQPYTMLFIALAVVLTMGEYAIVSDHTPAHLAVAAILVAATIGLYKYPGLCGICIVIVSLITTLSPTLPFSPLLWPHWLAYALVMFRRRYMPAAVLYLIDFLTFPAAHLVHAPIWTLGGNITLFSTFVVAGSVGFALSEYQQDRLAQEELQHLHQIEQERDRLHRNMALASKIHDSTARGLTFIALTADKGLHGTDEEERDACLRSIQSTAKTTLADVRDVIEALQCTDQIPQTVDTDADAFTNIIGALQQQLSENDRALESLGFHGTSTLDVSDETENIQLLNKIAAEIHDCVDQIYTNIVSHAVSGKDAYIMHIQIDGRGITITQFNECLTNTAAQHRSGYGLSLHERRIRSLGGMLEYSIDDNIWTLRIYVPLQERNKEN